MSRNTFGGWVIKHSKTLIGTGIVGTLVSGWQAVIAASKSMETDTGLQTARIITYAAQVLVVVVWFVVSTDFRRIVNSYAASGSDAAKSLRMFKVFWYLVLLDWALTYALYLLQSLPAHFGGPLSIEPWVFTILAKVETLAFFGMYVALSISKTRQTPDTALWIIACLFLFFLGFAEVLIDRIASHRGYAGGTISSTIGYSVLAVTIAMFAGRLDTPVITINPGIIAVLYGYAALQPLLPLAEAKFSVFIFSALVVMKTTLIAYVTWLVSTRLLEGYILLTSTAEELRPAT